ncbi:succinate dehydrogenase, cytochrome b556 subunit [Silanimonas sp.]|jgi:succinate dehydrogenase / fumarate reductase cytochrome b subunit|uniref:succinate dehydrogenase, cytochrome b556 subunit n=1 Tax=Silanimonas sp. TaxID=1929290 RepID=UPI0037C707EF
MATQQRPLSPHLQIYAKQITSTMSILHRMTGIVNALGVLVLAWWLVALASGGEAYAQFIAVAGSLPGKAALFGFAATLVYHLLNGVRHLVWDMGLGFEIPQVYRSGYTVIALAVVFTGLLWYAGLSVGGAA